jgi:hypothetical protein
MSRLTAALSGRRPVVVVAGVVVAIGVITFLTIRAGTRGDDLVPATEASTTVPLSGPHAELLRLFAQGRRASYAVVYRQVGPAGESVVRQARRPPEERTETESGTGEAVKRTTTVLTATGRVGCTQEGSGPWSCSPQPGRGGGALTDILSATIVSQMGALKAEASDQQVAGQDVRCFTLSGAEGPSAEMCLTTDGILARVGAGDTRLEMTALDRGAPPDSAFVPPAPVSG